MRGVFLALILAAGAGCALLDDDDDPCVPVKSERDIRVNGDVATVTNRTVDSCGDVDQATRVWLRQKDGSFKFAGRH
jgi:hypothetical protein